MFRYGVKAPYRFLERVVKEAAAAEMPPQLIGTGLF
jgi:hypothetical protein